LRKEKNMINQKRKKGNIFFLFILIFALNSTMLNASENECKKLDIKCKTKKFIDETKKFQKKGLKDSKQQIDKTKKKIGDSKDNILKSLSK